jgi:hypothetical protein
MSTDIKRAPVETPIERTEQKTDLDTKVERGGPQDAKTLRRLSIELIGLAAAALATIVMYVVFMVYPVAHPPLNEFLTSIFGRGNAAIWPMQLVWYASAAAMIGLAFWPRRLASQLICLLAAANFVWVGIVYFGVIDSSMGTLDGVINLAWLWAAVFILEAILFLVAGLVRRDLVFAPRWNLSSVLGALFMLYALVAYPIIEMLGGQPLSASPLFGLSPCVTVFFIFGLLLWARPPVPKYLLLLPLAWALTSAPTDLILGIVAVITVGVLIWRDRTSIWQTVAAALSLAAMIALSGHDDLLIGIALILVAVTFAQTLWTDVQRLHADLPPQPERVLTS